MSVEKQKKVILKKRSEGKVCFLTFDGLYHADVENFIEQPAEGILYDLNRGIETTLTIMPEKRWINDLAVAVTITALKKEIEGMWCAIEVISNSKDGSAIAHTMLHNRKVKKRIDESEGQEIKPKEEEHE